MNYSIEVVNAKDIGEPYQQDRVLPDGSYYIYCARPSYYGNPFPFSDERFRNHVIEEFRLSILPKLNLMPIFEKIKEYKSVKLGCWCKPKRCHCDIIKEALIESLEGEIFS